MSVHVPTVVWSLLTIMTPSGYGQQFATISRKDARLLAKRINQCLDDTSSKGKYGRRAGVS